MFDMNHTSRIGMTDQVRGCIDELCSREGRDLSSVVVHDGVFEKNILAVEPRNKMISWHTGRW